MPQEIIITNIKTAEYKLADLKKAFHYEGEGGEEFVHDMCRISSPTIGNQLYVVAYSIPPKKSNYPYHYHAAAEEVFYIISGNGILETPNGEIVISEGDVIVAPCGEKGAHKLTNSSEHTPLVYLDVDKGFPAEATFHPHTNKTVLTTRDFQKAYWIDSEVNYLEGE